MVSRKRTKNTAEIVTVGNEILIGHTQDTNSHWIAKQFTHHGWHLSRTTTILDSIDQIEAAVRDALKRKPTLLITLGGLGPTPDDMTLKGVARGLRSRLVLNKEALEMVRRYYTRMEEKTEITASRRKMATLPAGAHPLRNPVGTAPGVLIDGGKTLIVSLPGVPREMEEIFTDSIVPILKRTGSEAPDETTIQITGIIESALAPIIVKARQKFPGLYFKSHPRGAETGTHPLILLHVYSVNEKARDQLGTAAAFVLNELAQLGTRINSTPNSKEE